VIRFNFSGDDLPQGTPAGVPDDDQNSWWSGAQKSFAVVAIAATLAAASLSTQVAAATAGPSDEQIPAGQLHGQPDEDFWQNPAAPIAASLEWPQPFSFEQNESPTLNGQPDEDFWQSGVAPIASYPPPIVFRDDDVIGTPPTSIHTDEDFWINPVAPVPATNGHLYLPDPEEIPAAGLRGQPDEDFWQNPVAPQVAALQFPQPFSFDDGVIVIPPVLPQQDEDFWFSNVVPVSSYPFPRVFSADDVLVPAILEPDEDFWINPVPARPATLLPLLLWGQDDLGGLSVEHGPMPILRVASIPALAILGVAVVPGG